MENSQENLQESTKSALTFKSAVSRRELLDPLVDGPITLPEAVAMETDYLNSPSNMRFRYHDLQDHTVVKMAVFKGFSLDAANVRTVIDQKGCDKLFIAIGVKKKEIVPGGGDDEIFTAILYGLQKDATPANGDPFPYTKIIGTNGVIVDYSDPCPPYCPKP